MPLPKQCPLCFSDHEKINVKSHHVYGGDKNHSIFSCTNCSVKFLYPGLSKTQEAELYAKEFEAFMSDRSADDAGWEQPERHISSNQSQFVRRKKYLDPLLQKSGRMLEVGCSSGFMLYPYAHDGWECVGVEPSGVFSDYVKSREIECYNDLSELTSDPDYSEYFDVIMHFFVLEHVKNAKDFLDAQMQLLKPGGQIIFEIPNSNDALSEIYDIPEYDRFIWVISHHWYFDQPSLKYLLNQISPNNEVRTDQRYDLSNHFVWARDGKPGGMSKFTEKFGKDLEETYKKSLIESGYGDTLIAIIKK